MRPVIIVGLVVTAVATFAGYGLLLLLVAIVLSTSSGPGYQSDFGTYPGGYGESADAYGRSPADPWLNGNEIDGRWTGGTIDGSGEGNHVLSVGGEVLNLPN